MQNPINDLRSAIALLQRHPGHYIETDHPVDPNAELAGVYRHIGAGGTVKRPTRTGPANSMNIPAPLLDRMEVIRLSGYTEDEKLNIAKQHLLPKQIERNALKANELTVEDSAIIGIIRYYTREAGVRSLEREISKLCRKAVKQLLLDKSLKHITINGDNLWSMRTFWNRNRSLWCGWVFEGRHRRFWFSGDTGYSPELLLIPERLGKIDAAALPIGAYAPRWFMAVHHMDPQSAVALWQQLGSPLAFPIHWGVFELADESLDEPVRELTDALVNLAPVNNSFRILKIGEYLSL